MPTPPANRAELIEAIVDALEPTISRNDCRREIEEILPDWEQQFCIDTGIAPPGNRTLGALAESPATTKELRDAHSQIADAFERVARARANFPPGAV